MDMSTWNEFVDREKLKEKDEYYVSKGRYFLKLLQEDDQWMGVSKLKKWTSHDQETKDSIAADLKDYLRLLGEDYVLKRMAFWKELEEKQGYRECTYLDICTQQPALAVEPHLVSIWVTLRALMDERGLQAT